MGPRPAGQGWERSDRTALVKPGAMCLWKALALILAVSATLGCVRESAEPLPEPAEPCRPQNLILISVDTLRSDHLGTYGYERATSPFIDELAARGTVFERAYSTGSWTIPSHASMMTGLYPRRHGMRRGARTGRTAIPADVETLAEAFQRGGFATSGISNMLYLSKQNGFHRGFGSWSRIGPAQGPGGSMSDISFRALDWVDENPGESFFMFLHVYDVHSDYHPLKNYRRMFAGRYDGPVVDGVEKPLKDHRKGHIKLGPADAKHLVDLYDAEIRQFDAGLRRFFALLAAAGVLDDTAVVITADHGEEFLEHGDFLHGRTLYEELVRVPWIMVGPCVPAARVEAPVSLVDVLPTALALMGVEQPAGIDGLDVSTWSQESAAPSDRPLYLEADEWYGIEEGEFRRAVVHGGRKLHLDGKTGHTEVYDLGSDPGEHTNLAEAGEAAPELEGHLNAFLESPERTGAALGAPSKDTLRQLRALGYID